MSPRPVPTTAPTSSGSEDVSSSSNAPGDWLRDSRTASATWAGSPRARETSDRARDQNSWSERTRTARTSESLSGKWRYSQAREMPASSATSIIVVRRIPDRRRHRSAASSTRSVTLVATGSDITPSPQNEVVEVGLPGPTPVVDQPPRAEAVDLAEGVLEERMLDRRLGPHQRLDLALGALVPVLVLGRGRLHGLMTAGDELLDALGDVAHLALGVEDQAAPRGQVGAGPV